jgi:hypothetical protein
MLDRLSQTIASVTVATAVASSEEIRLSSYAGGMIFVPAGSSITTLTWYAAEKPDGTYLVAYDEDNIAVTQTVQAGRCYPIPSALFGCRAIKAVDAAGGYLLVSLKG